MSNWKYVRRVFYGWVLHLWSREHEHGYTGYQFTYGLDKPIGDGHYTSFEEAMMAKKPALDKAEFADPGVLPGFVRFRISFSGRTKGAIGMHHWCVHVLQVPEERAVWYRDVIARMRASGLRPAEWLRQQEGFSSQFYDQPEIAQIYESYENVQFVQGGYFNLQEIDCAQLSAT